MHAIWIEDSMIDVMADNDLEAATLGREMHDVLYRSPVLPMYVLREIRLPESKITGVEYMRGFTTHLCYETIHFGLPTVVVDKLVVAASDILIRELRTPTKKDKTVTVIWESHYGIARCLTLRHAVDFHGMLYLSPRQAQKVRRELANTGDYYPGLQLPLAGEGCWLPNPE